MKEKKMKHSLVIESNINNWCPTIISKSNPKILLIINKKKEMKHNRGS